MQKNATYTFFPLPSTRILIILTFETNIYWRLLSADPVTTKEVVLSEKPLISEETDLIEPTLLDELICHIGSLASVYHKPPNAFVEGSHGIHRKHLPIHHGR